MSSKGQPRGKDGTGETKDYTVVLTEEYRGKLGANEDVIHPTLGYHWEGNQLVEGREVTFHVRRNRVEMWVLAWEGQGYPDESYLMSFSLREIGEEKFKPTKAFGKQERVRVRCVWKLRKDCDDGGYLPTGLKRLRKEKDYPGLHAIQPGGEDHKLATASDLDGILRLYSDHLAARLVDIVFFADEFVNRCGLSTTSAGPGAGIVAATLELAKQGRYRNPDKTLVCMSCWRPFEPSWTDDFLVELLDKSLPHCGRPDCSAAHAEGWTFQMYVGCDRQRGVTWW